MPNPFDDLIPSAPQARPRTNPFDDIATSGSSTLGTVGRGIAESVTPTAAGFGAAAALTPWATAAAPATFGLSYAAPVVAGIGAGMATSLAQRKLVPESVQRRIFLRPEDVQAHPVAATLSQAIPSLAAFRPGIPKNLAQLRIALASGGIGGGVEAAREVATGEKLQPGRIATQAGLGATLTQPTRLGGRLFPRARVEPTPKEAIALTPLEAEKSSRVSRVLDALKAAKPVRATQEKLYTEARSQKMARALGVREQVGGEQGYYAELGQLKGELPRAQFEPLRSNVSQADIDGLMNDINTSGLDFWETLPAKEGLIKMLGGRVPTANEILKLKQVFGPELPKALEGKRPLLSRLGRLGLDVAGSMRAMSAGLGDMSFPLRQGIFVFPRHPIIFTKAFGRMVRQFFDPRFYEASQQQIAQRPSYKLMQEHGLQLTGKGLREEPFQGSIPERIPGVRIGMRAAERAYSGMGNRLRADIFDLFVKANEQAGEDIFDLTHAANFINTATGRGTLRIPGTLGIAGSPTWERAAPILNATLFSPRLLASRLNLLDPMYYISLQPAVRKEALKSLLAFAAAGAGAVGLAKMAGVTVGTDYRSADFGKIKFGNTRWDIWGGFQQPVVAALRLLTGKMVSSTTGREFNLGEGYKATTRGDILARFAGSKTSPPVRLALALLQGKTGAGQPFRAGPEIVDAFLPMVVQDVYELLREHGPKQLWMAPLSFFGSGVQTYGGEIPQRTTTPSGRETISFRSEPSLGETIVNRMTGTQVSNIPQSLHPQLERTHRVEQRRQVLVDAAKKRVLQSGQPEFVNGTRVWLEKGIVKTKNFRDRQTPVKVYERATGSRLSR